MFLTKDELRELTGYKRASAQIRWLNKNGYSYAIGADGFPRVLYSFIHLRLGDTYSKPIEERPNFAAIL